MPRFSRYLCINRFHLHNEAGIRLARDKQVNVRVIPTSAAVAESVDLAYEIFKSRVSQGPTETTRENEGLRIENSVQENHFTKLEQMIKFTKQYKPIGFGDRPNPGTVEGHRNAMAEAVETRKLLGDHATTDLQIEEQNEIAEYIFGMVAKRDGQPMNRTKSPAWQRGWAEAQE